MGQRYRKMEDQKSGPGFMGISNGGGGGQVGPCPLLDFHTLSKTSRISKILQFLVVNTGFIFIGPLLKNFLATLLPGLACNLDFAKGKGLERKLKKFSKIV